MNRSTYKIYKIHYILPLILVILFSCAQQASLTGGDKDVLPPVILKQEPPNFTTLFRSPTLQIFFDEYVELSNPLETFLISPPLPEQPDYLLNGKVLIITLNNQLEENTTYIINCNQGIKDLTEGNFLPLSTFVFSTGDYIDSLSLIGTVRDAFTLLPEEKTGVMLYKQNDDSALLILPPYYYTVTDNEGHFRFSNIAAGEYQLVALIDKNKNYIFDQNDEKIAFASAPVKAIYIPPVVAKDSVEMKKDWEGIKKDSGDIKNNLEGIKKDSLDSKVIQDSSVQPSALNYAENTLWLFQEQDTSTHFIRRDFKGNYRHDFIFKNEVADFKLNQITNQDTLILYFIHYTKTGDTVQVFLTTFAESDVDFEVYANQQLLDTITFNPSQKGSARRVSRRTTDTSGVYLTFQEITKGAPDKDPAILFESPIANFDLTQCVVIETRKDQSDTLPLTAYFADSLHRLLAFQYPFKEKTSYTLLCPDSLFWSYYGACNDTIRISFTTKSLKEYGSIQIQYQFEEENQYIVQLLSEKSELVKEDFLTGAQAITYNYLPAAKYRIRVIVDANKNHKWDSGNYILRQQPEKVIYFEKSIDLPANWKIEETFAVRIE
jgi:uncharacterized protein (DUF2141 family)